MALDSRYAGSGFKVDVYIKSVHEQLQLNSVFQGDKFTKKSNLNLKTNITRIIFLIHRNTPIIEKG